MKLFRLFTLFLLFVLVLHKAPSVNAFEVRTGDSVHIDHGQALNGSLFASGSTVVVDGIVHGDVFCAGNHITISGLIDGDVLCAGQTIQISGVVLGNVRLAGQSIDISGVVRQNATVFGQTVTVPGGGSVVKELFLGAQTFSMEGMAGKALGGFAQTATLNGEVNGDVTLMGESVNVEDKAVVRGNFDYTSKNTATIAKGAAISGRVTHEQPKVDSKKSNGRAVNPGSSRLWPLNALPSIVWYLIVGFIIVQFFPKSTERILAIMTDNPVRTGLIGFLGLIAVPMVAILLVLTLIGIPFAIITFIIYAMAIGISQVYVAIFAGKYILESFAGKARDHRYLPMVVGVPVLFLILKLPILGGLISCFAVAWGFGGLILCCWPVKKNH